MLWSSSKLAIHYSSDQLLEALKKSMNMCDVPNAESLAELKMYFDIDLEDTLKDQLIRELFNEAAKKYSLEELQERLK